MVNDTKTLQLIAALNLSNTQLIQSNRCSKRNNESLKLHCHVTDIHGEYWQTSWGVWRFWLSLLQMHTVMPLQEGHSDVCVLWRLDDSEADGDEVEYGYPITCGDSRAVLLFKKFVCPGINVRCVKVSWCLVWSFNYYLIITAKFIFENLSPRWHFGPFCLITLSET